MNIPVLKDIVRQHAEQAAFLWTVYDWHLLHPEENEEMDEERLERLIEQLEAHLDGVRVAGKDGAEIAEDRYAEFPEAGELWLLRMLQPSAMALGVRDLDLDQVRAYLRKNLDT